MTLTLTGSAINSVIIYIENRLHETIVDIHHCLLYEFQKIYTEAIKNICDVCPDALKARMCQLGLKSFKDSDCDISDKPRFGRRFTINAKISTSRHQGLSSKI